MAREIKVSLGGEDRVLWFHAKDGITIKEKLGKRPMQVLDEDIAPVRQRTEAERAANPELADQGIMMPWDVDINALAWVLQIAIVRKDPRVTYDMVLDWITAYVQSASLMGLVGPVKDAMLLSGVCGVPIDLEAIRKVKEAEKAAKEQVDPEAGKDSSVPSLATP